MNNYQIQEENGQVQVNCFVPPKGKAAFFVVYPEGQKTKAIEAADRLFNKCPLEPNKDLTSLFDGALAVGTVPMPQFKLS